MQTKLALSMIALLVAAAIAAGPVDDFMKRYTEPDQQLALSRVYAESGEYILIRLDGQEAFLLDNISGAQVDSQADIERIFREDVYSRAGYANKSGSLRIAVEDFNSTRAPAERTCRQYTGTDNRPCTDKESCVLACRVVPVCGGNEGQGGPLYADGFIESVLSWSANTYGIDRLSSELSSGIDAMGEGGGAIDAQIGRIDSIVSLARANQENGLFKGQQNPECLGPEGVHCYDFCPAIDYSIEELLSSRSMLVVLKTQLSALGLQHERAAKLSEHGAEQIAYISGRGAMLARHRLLIVDARGNATRAFAEINKSVSDSELLQSMLDLEQRINQSNGYEKAGMFKLAFATAPDIVAMSEAIVNRSALLASQKAALLHALAVAKSKVDRASGVGANASVIRGLNFTYARLSQKLSERIDSSEFAAASSQIASLDGEAEDAILRAVLSNVTVANQTAQVANATNETGGNKPGGGGCAAPVAVLGVALIGAFLGRRG